MKAMISTGRAAILVLAAASVPCAVLAQNDGGPPFRPSGQPGVNVRVVPERAAPRAQAARVRNRGVRLRNRRTVRLRRGGTAILQDVDPASLPYHKATVGADGQVSLRCVDPAHRHLGSLDHGARHRAARKAAATSAARPRAAR